MNRRKFIKNATGWALAGGIFVPKLIRAQALSLNDPVFLANQTPAVGPLSGPINRWKLNEGSGSTANDSGSGGYAGTLVGTPTWDTPNGVTLNGTSQYVTTACPTTWADNMTAFTVSCWIQTSLTSWGNGSMIVGKVAAGGVATGVGWFIGAEDPIIVAQLQGTSGYAGPSYNWVNGGMGTAWTMITATYSNVPSDQLVVMYVNGAVLGYQGYQGGPFDGGVSNANTIEIGNDVSSEYWQGGISDVCVWNRILGATEISALYSAGRQ